MELNKLVTAIKAGLEVRGDGSPRCGCGRAYVCLSSKDRRILNLFKKAFTEVGLRYIGPAYGSGSKSAYIGYDNGNGVPLAQAEAIAKNLNDIGVSCYADGVSD